MKALRIALPLLLLAVLAFFLWRGLSLNPREIPSALIGKSVPEFSLPRLDAPQEQGGPAEMKGRVWLLNVWASWCGSCIIEHPLLLDLSRRGVVEIVGLDYKDDAAAAGTWLKRNGNPYAHVWQDPDGRTGIDLGVYGVPETFLVDAGGIVRARHVGPLTQDFIDKTLLPLLAKER